MVSYARAEIHVPDRIDDPTPDDQGGILVPAWVERGLWALVYQSGIRLCAPASQVVSVEFA